MWESLNRILGGLENWIFTSAFPDTSCCCCILSMWPCYMHSRDSWQDKKVFKLPFSHGNCYPEHLILNCWLRNTIARRACSWSGGMPLSGEEKTPQVYDKNLQFSFLNGKKTSCPPPVFFSFFHTESFTSDNSGHRMCGGFPPPSDSLWHQLGAQQFNLVLTLSTWR